ncbi:hypothetical protein E1162_08335 [Rhodobacteraceae bacterium RKSG542]|uniref:ferredoxin reductase family protein n=1 Tax=Pseudovibrio flavus TaxID=2529854 RepID=UPI0012BB5F49|nr:ferric reductase-like transmembrane domain-containing protein [Pseudovibrio flavus]MTI17249.1 hypothetical protein [Pseudovibrio flavus]
MNARAVAVAAMLTFFPLVGFLPLYSTYSAEAVTSLYIGSAALVVMGFSQFLALRLPWMERLTGGLDRSYLIHKWLGIAAVVFLLLHENISAEIKSLAYQNAFHGLAKDLGEFGLNGILVLSVVSIATFIPYNLWRWSHRLIGIFFILGAVHYVLIEKPFSLTSPLGLYVLFFCVLGVASYLYALIAFTVGRKSVSYVVRKNVHQGDVAEISMTPVSTGISHRAGQFAFFSFDQGRLKEAHPFTISSAPVSDQSLRISVKKLGDYTGRLGRDLKVGTAVKIAGPYGRFGVHKCKGAQVWIGAGVGITPFAAMAQALEKAGPSVHLFYCVRNLDQAPHVAELRAIEAENNRFHLHLIVSDKGQKLNADVIEQVLDGPLAKASVFFCGPKPMRESFKASLSKRGVAPNRFFYEEFEIRSGIGLGRLARLLWPHLRNLLNKALGEKSPFHEQRV